MKDGLNTNEMETIGTFKNKEDFALKKEENVELAGNGEE